MTVMDYIQGRRSEPFNPPKKRQNESRIAIKVKEKRRKEKKEEKDKRQQKKCNKTLQKLYQPSNYQHVAHFESSASFDLD